MFPNFRRCCFGIAFLLTLVHRAPGDDDRQLFGKPEKPEDYWRRVKFEIEVGKFDYAAKYLKGFVEELKKLKADEAGQILVKIEEKEGISAFLRLKRIPPLLEDKKDQKALEAVIKQLNEQVSTAVSKFLNDPVRIRKYLKNLTKTPEERAWAIKELRRSRQAIIPYVIQELQFTAGKVEHEKIMTALSTILRTDQAILPPLLAALDLNDNILRADILILLRDHGRARDVAHLWYLSAAKNLPLAVRTFTTKIIARLLETEVDQLPHAKVALTKLAEIYYRHQVKFTNSNEIVVWKLDPKKKELAPVKMTANQVEEYYGLRYARQALDLDAEYQPAQVMFLSVALDKAYGSDIHLPIKAKAPRIKALMATLSPELLTDVLDRAMRERRLPE